MPVLHCNRTRKPAAPARGSLLESLEARQLLSGTILHAYSPHLLNGNGSDVVATIGNLVSRGVAFSDLHVVLTWDDGSITFGQLSGHLTPGAPIPVHPPLDVTIGNSTHTLGAHSALVFVYQTNAAGKIINYALFTSHVTIDQNSTGGLAVTTAAGQAFSGKVATLGQLHVPDSFSGQTANFFVPAPDGISGARYVVSIAWGDGTSSTANIVKNDQGTWDVDGSHTYAFAGNYRITVTAGSHYELSPTAPPGTVTMPIGMLIEIEAGTATVSGQDAAFAVSANATRSFTTPLATLSTVPSLPVEIYWGDGTRSVATYHTLTDGSVQLIGSHTYKHAGSFQVEVRGLFDNGVDLFTTATVNPANTVIPSPQVSGTPIVGGPIGIR